MNRFEKKLHWFLLLAAASLFFAPLGARALWDSDEGRYAEIAREMLQLKDWVTPHLNYVVYFEKPPLVYWLTAISLSVFGPTPFAARFWSAIFGVLTVAVVYRAGKYWKSERTGLLAGSILATSVLFFALTQYLVLDMALTFWMTLSLYASMRIISERMPPRVASASLLFALAAAGGILTKGPVALILPGTVLALTMAYTRTLGEARKIAWKKSFLIITLIVAPWFLLVSARQPYFLPFFFIHEHLARFLTGVHHRTAPFYFFVPVVLAGFVPWTFFLPAALGPWFIRRGAAMKRDPVSALLVIWSAFIFIFFSLSQSKLPAYMLPVFPALALLTGAAFEEALMEETMPVWIQQGIAGLVILFVAVLVLLKVPFPFEFLSSPPVQAVHAQSGLLAIILGVGVFVLVGVAGMRQVEWCFGGVMLVQVMLLATLASLASALDPYLSTRELAETLNEKAPAQALVASYGISYENRLQSLVFYTGRRVAVFGDPGELELGQQHDPDAAQWFAGPDVARDALIHLPTGSWALTDEERWNALAQSDLASSFALVQKQGDLRLFQKIR